MAPKKIDLGSEADVIRMCVAGSSEDRPMPPDPKLARRRHLVRVNDRIHEIEAAERTPLLYVLRNDLELNGPKYGCGLGECGSCSVLIDGRAARSCTVPIGALADRSVTTLEGLAGPNGLHPVQEAFIAEDAAQCGYCLNGMIMTTVALLAKNPRPSDDDIRLALRHNLCRCGTHIEIMRAIRRAVAVAMPLCEGEDEGSL